jgi:hypothetical protein
VCVGNEVFAAPTMLDVLAAFAAFGNRPFFCDQKARFRRRKVEYLARIVSPQVDPVDFLCEFLQQAHFHPAAATSNERTSLN